MPLQYIRPPLPFWNSCKSALMWEISSSFFPCSLSCFLHYHHLDITLLGTVQFQLVLSFLWNIMFFLFCSAQLSFKFSPTYLSSKHNEMSQTGISHAFAQVNLYHIYKFMSNSRLFRIGVFKGSELSTTRVPFSCRLGRAYK